MNSLLLALSLLLWAPVRAGVPEQLPGFAELVSKQTSDRVGLDRLPRAVGLPIEPGLYATIGSREMVVFDTVSVPVQNGAFGDGAVAANCKSACSAAAYDLFRGVWFELAAESQAVVVDFPSRVLLAADATLPAKLFVDAAYAAAEARPRGVPTLHMLVYDPQAGLRARPFFLVPPGGLALSRSTNSLGLRIGIEPGQSFTIEAASPGFQRTVRVTGLELLKATAADVKKHYPGKEVVQLDVRGNVSVAELAAVMVAVEHSFPVVVFSAGHRVSIQ